MAVGNVYYIIRNTGKYKKVFIITGEKVREILRFYSLSKREIEINDRMIKNLLATYTELPDEIKKEIEDIKVRKQYIYNVRHEIITEIQKVTTPNRLMVYEAYILNNNWIQISIKYNYSTDACRHFAYKGINELGILFSNNKILSEF